ncbi:MAG: RNA polymerase sigma factor [Acidimicrobiia bacterium]
MGTNPTIEDFYREHATSVYAFCVSLCRDRTWAEDLMQETFVKATRAIGGYRGGNPRSWLFTIARSVFIDDVRKRRPVPTDQVVDAATTDPDVAEMDAIQAALSTLPERQRIALLLADRAGLPHSEVAEAVGATPAAVRVLIHRARINFRSAYEKESR